MGVLEIVAQVLIVAGAALFASAGLGLLRLRDAYARSSAVATAAGLGVGMIVLGALLLQPSVPNAAKAGVAILLQLATSAIGSMAIARSAYLVGSPMVPDPQRDDLADPDAPAS